MEGNRGEEVSLIAKKTRERLIAKVMLIKSNAILKICSEQKLVVLNKIFVLVQRQSQTK